MAWPIRKARLAQFALLTVVAGEVSWAAAEVLILRSEGARASRHYRTGTRHPDNKIFELRPGDSLVILASGGTRTWNRPGFYSLVQPARPLVMNGRQVRVETGAVRSAPIEPGVKPTAVWEYDIRHSGPLCVPNGGRPTLWRPRDAAPARITITTAGGATHSFDWPAGTITMEWPAALPVTDGGSYLITSSRDPRTVRVTAQVLPALAAGDTAQLATRLVAERCSGQLDTLIATRIDATAPALAEPETGGAARSR